MLHEVSPHSTIVLHEALAHGTVEYVRRHQTVLLRLSQPVVEVLAYLCAGLTNQLLSYWVDPCIAWKNIDTAIVAYRETGMG